MMEVYTVLSLVLTTAKKGSFRGRVAHQTKRQICSILNSDKKELKIVALPVQQ